MGIDEPNGLGTKPEDETLEGIAPPRDEGAPAPPSSWLGATAPLGAPPAAPPPPPPRRAIRLPFAVALLILAAGAVIAGIIAFGDSNPGGTGPQELVAAPSPSLLAPTGLKASAKAFSVSLSWTQPAGGTAPKTYVLYRNHSLVDELSADATNFVDKGVDPGKKYTYELEAKSGDLQTGFVTVKVTTPTPPLGDARLSGDYNVKFVFVSSDGFQSTTKNFTAGWHFKPTCPSGGCDVIWTDLTEKSLKATLDRRRDHYGGKDSGTFFATCGSTHVTSTITISFRVTKAKGEDGEWLATKIVGTVDHAAAAQLGCVPSSARLKITGTLLS